MSLSIGALLDVKVEKMVVGGSGLARHQGAVIFIPKSAPEDFLKIKITEAKKNFFTAEIVEILNPSPHRRSPPCKYFSDCGGCSWQHLNEESQLKFKLDLVKETLEKFLPDVALPDFRIIPSPKNLRYRNRIQPKFKNSQLGFFSANSHDIVAIEDCLLAEEKLMSIWPSFKDKVFAQFAGANPNKDELRFELYLDENETPHWYEMGQEKDSLGFSQVNRFQNQQLVETLLQWSLDCDEKPPRVLDLYAGAGNFSFPLSQSLKKSQVIAVELHQKLSQLARKKAEALGLTPKQFQIFCSDVPRFIKKFKLNDQDLVVLDPPRTGTDALVMKALAQAQIRRFLYVSCHPVTFARDLKVFFQEAKRIGSNAKLVRLVGFDMFPQTDHIELLSEVRIDS